MAGKKKKKAVKVDEPTITVGKGEKVVAKKAIAEVPTIKVRCPKRGVRMMTPAQYAEYSKERDG